MKYTIGGKKIIQNFQFYFFSEIGKFNVGGPVNQVIKKKRPKCYRDYLTLDIETFQRYHLRCYCYRFPCERTRETKQSDQNTLSFVSSIINNCHVLTFGHLEKEGSDTASHARLMSKRFSF